ncbi:MAG TPA: TolC family protein [Acidobacteriaceae bacterium]|nr:TolC family protein [Acidobacteriaceae bacterium]
MTFLYRSRAGSVWRPSLLNLVAFTLFLHHAGAQQQSAAAAQGPAPAITLDQAIARARVNEPNFVAAIAASRNAALDRSIARAALLPGVAYNNQYVYTQPSHCPSTNQICLADSGQSASAASTPVRFIANNSVHEYVSQASVTELLGAQQWNAVSKASASLAVATAELEIARRGLVSTVAGLFYGVATASRRVAIAQRATDEAASLTQLTSQRETAREAAHADVVKAQLQQQQRDRDLADAQLRQAKAHLELAVLLFPDPRSEYTVAASDLPPSVPSRADVEAALAKHNPELESALASSRLASLNVLAARLAYLPSLELNYSYGIDSTHFAMMNADGSRNLGYSASASLNVPVWDWFTTRDKVRQSEISRDAARVLLSNTQRKVIADLEEGYAEAVAAREQLDSLSQSVATATESLRLTRLAYAAGETPILSVVDAENSLTTSETAREDGILRYQTALANLQLLTGTLQ